jgi:outer membrane protein OmpA-like peptidoglycan-associated protein
MLTLFLVACGPAKPFIPQNVGRQYGREKLPLMVSHLPDKNRWTLNRVKHRHHIFNKTLCFNYICRKMIGHSKTLLTISRKEFIKVIKRNAERGLLNNIVQPAQPKPVKRDTVSIKQDTVIAKVEIPTPQPVEPTLKADSLITLSEFLFETNSAKLKNEHYEELDQLSSYLQLHPNLKVTITGHTDNVGEERHNVMLSTRRAEAVTEYLVGKGADYDKITFRGVGSAQPVVSNETNAGRSKNRRVEILISNQ